MRTEKDMTELLDALKEMLALSKELYMEIKKEPDTRAICDKLHAAAEDLQAIYEYARGTSDIIIVKFLKRIFEDLESIPIFNHSDIIKLQTKINACVSQITVKLTQKINV
jgi:glycerophosphoryl diester phosphodiesterase